MEVKYYEKKNGEKPAFDFIESLDEKSQSRIVGAIQLLIVRGSLLRGPYSKMIDKNLFELRVVSGSNYIRVFYFFVKGGRAYLTNGFIKKTNKTPQREIDKAIRYRNDYFLRNGEIV